MKKILLLVFSSLASFISAETTQGKEFVIGQIVDTSGEFQKYAAAITEGISACFNEVNKNGGINGKKIRLEVQDCKGSLKKIEAISHEFKKQGISIFLGCMGTRNVTNFLPQIEAGSITMLFPWGGNDALRNPKIKHIINGPGLLQPQLENIANHVGNILHSKKTVIFHANDSFSISASKELQKIFAKQAFPITKIVNYNGYTLNINKAAEELINLEPRAVICIGTSMPAAKLIKNFFSSGLYKTTFFGIDSTFMTHDILADFGATFYYTSAVPEPKRTKIPIAEEYLKALNREKSIFYPNILSFTYYICAKLLVDALRKNTNRNDIITHFESLNTHNLGGFSVSFDNSNRHLFGSSSYLIKD